MMCCVIKAMPISFINGKKLKSYRMSLTNHTEFISHHIMSLVINGLGDGHTDTDADIQTHRHTDTHTHTHTHSDMGTKTISRN